MGFWSKWFRNNEDCDCNSHEGVYTYHSKGKEATFENTPHQWILAMDAIFSAYNENFIDLIGGREITSTLKNHRRTGLEEWWGIHDRESLLEMLSRLADDLEEKENEKIYLAWDYVRYTHLCGWGYSAGYLDKSEFWEMTLPIARVLQKNFKSWEDLGRHYIDGSDAHFSDPERDKGLKEAFSKLLKDPSSPWVQIEFKSVKL